MLTHVTVVTVTMGRGMGWNGLSPTVVHCVLEYTLNY